MQFLGPPSLALRRCALSNANDLARLSRDRNSGVVSVQTLDSKKSVCERIWDFESMRFVSIIEFVELRGERVAFG